MVGALLWLTFLVAMHKLLHMKASALAILA